MQHVDYEATMAIKISIAKQVFNLEKESVFNSASFQKFFLENQVCFAIYPFLFRQSEILKPVSLLRTLIFLF